MAKRTKKLGVRKGDPERSDKVLAFIKHYRASHRYPPSLRDICAALDISTTNARLHLNRLAQEGKIERDPRISRGIRLKE